MSADKGKKKKSVRQVLAIAGIVLLVALYVLTFILSLIDSPNSRNWLFVSIMATVVIPVMLYGYLLMSKWAKGRKDYNDAVLNPKFEEPETDREN